MRDGVLLLPSPLLPASAYDDLVGALTALGAATSVAPAELGPRQGSADLIRRWAALDGGQLLLAHSNAGYLAPSVRALSDANQPIVFMDAALPPEAGTTCLAPSAFRASMAELADDGGVLPPWTRWWTAEELAGVVPSHRFDALDLACPRLPLDYFDAEIDPPPRWAEAPNAYLAFSRTYADEMAFATSHGWPTVQLDGAHLHFLHEPALVAEHVQALAAALSATHG